MEPAPLELEDTVARVIEDFTSRVGDRHVFRSRCVDGDWPRVNGDGEHVTRVLTNLLLGACKRSPGGCEVEVSVRREDGHAVVSVSDRGIGLSQEAIANAFERFSPISVPGDADLRSTGLELYKARRLVELHGGTIRAESDGENGSTFAFTIPLAEEELE